MKSLQTSCEHSLSPADKLPHEGVLHFVGKRLNVLRVASHPCLTRSLQTALLLLFASLSPHSWGDPIGRLFFTPAERTNLDRARLTGDDSEQEGAPAQQSDSLTLNGIVKRHNGKTTVWVNHAVQNESDFPSGSKMQIGKSRLPNFPVLVQKTGKTVSLKVGQTLNVDSGEIREIYQLPPGKEAMPATATQDSATAAKTPDPAAIAAALRKHS